MPFDQRGLSDYIDVAQRLADFREQYPQGSLQPLDLSKPWEQATVTGYDRDGNPVTQTFVVYAAAAYRSPDDVRPGIGIAWEVFPGRTNFTRGSELMNCFSSETEVLTEDGWVLLTRLPRLLRVASARRDGTWQFDYPTVYLEARAQCLVTIEDNLTRQCVTPDHRVLCGTQVVPAAAFAEGTAPERGNIPHAGLLTERIGSLNFATEDYARLLQWVIADGCYPKVNCEPITFGFLKLRKVERLTALLDRMGVTYWHGVTAQGRHDFRLGAKDPVVKAVRLDIPGKTLTDRTALKFTHAQAVAFIEEGLHTDGTPATHGGIYFRSADRSYIEALCLLGAAHGYDATSLAFDEPPGSFPNGKPIHRVRLKRSTRRLRKKVTVQNMDEPVPVFCVTMPLGTVVTRNQGKVTVSGNCETSAWGRAILAALASDSRKGVASREEVRNRQAEQETQRASASQRTDGPPRNTDGSLSVSRMDDAERAAAGLMTKPETRAHNALRRDGEPDPRRVQRAAGPDEVAAQWETR